MFCETLRLCFSLLPWRRQKKRLLSVLILGQEPARRRVVPATPEPGKISHSGACHFSKEEVSAGPVRTPVSWLSPLASLLLCLGLSATRWGRGPQGTGVRGALVPTGSTQAWRLLLWPGPLTVPRAPVLCSGFLDCPQGEDELGCDMDLFFSRGSKAGVNQEVAPISC